MTYASYELFHGDCPDFADLRSAEPEVLAAAQLTIDPFEEGSFVVPARLTEDAFGDRSVTGAHVLQRFVDSLEAISNGNTAISMGFVQTVEDLGRIIKREATVEYSAFGLPSMPTECKKLVIDSKYISRVTATKLKRRSKSYLPDLLEGVITAVDIIQFTFSIQIAPKIIVRGSYESLVQDKISTAVGERVKVMGVVEYVNEQPRHIRAFTVELIE